MSKGEKLLCDNRGARHSYEIIESLEVGIALEGAEVKSLRSGSGNLNDSYANVTKEGEIFVRNFHISPYDKAGVFVPDSRRPRKLLLHKREITRLGAKVREKGLTLIPLKAYLKGGRVKLELGLAKGKNVHSKRETLKERDIRKDVARELKNLNR